MLVVAVPDLAFWSFRPETRGATVLSLMLVALAFSGALIWLPAAMARHELNQERARHGMPTQPIPVAVLVIVSLVLAAVAFVGYSLRTEGPWSSSDNIAQSLAGTVASVGFWLVSLFWRSKALESPRNRVMLDREWYQLHGVRDPEERGGRP